jgi:IS5 family transposase
VNDRRSFEEFVGLGMMNNRPDASTIVFFRERLRKAGLIEEILSCLSSTSDPRVCRPVAAR